MEIVEPFAAHFLQTSASVLLYCALWSALTVLTYRSLTKRKYLETSCRTSPGLKIPIYSIFGILRFLPSNSVMKTLLLPPTVFLIHVASGLAAIFPKEKVLFCRAGFARFALITKPESAEELLNNNTLLEKSWMYDMLHSWLGNGLITSSGTMWRSRRKLLTPSFHFGILKEFVPVLDEQSKVLVETLKRRHQEAYIDILPLVSLCTLDIICETTLGIHVGAQTNSNLKFVQSVKRVSKAAMARMVNPLMYSEIVFSLTSGGRQYKKDVKYLHNFSRTVIRQRKEDAMKKQNEGEELFDENKKKRKALLDFLLDLHIAGRDFTEEDIREEIDTILFAGHDTSAVGTCWALYLIGLYPEIQTKIHEELDMVFGDDYDFSESQRLYPSVAALARKVEDDFYLCGHKIKKGTTLGLLPYVLHRNPEVFPDPEKFDPDRFLPENCVGRHPFSYVPFSAGPRNCIGQRFAMLEEKTLIANILRNFSVKSLEQRDKVFPNAEVILRPFNPLKLKFTPRG